MNVVLSRDLIGINWDFSQMIRDNVLEAALGGEGRENPPSRSSAPTWTDLEKYA